MICFTGPTHFGSCKGCGKLLNEQTGQKPSFCASEQAGVSTKVEFRNKLSVDEHKAKAGAAPILGIASRTCILLNDIYYGVQNHPITLSFVANVGEVTITGESRSGRRRASLTANLPGYSPKKGGRLPPRPAAQDGAVYPNADGAYLKDEVSVTGFL